MGLREPMIMRSIRTLIQRNAQQDIALARSRTLLENIPKELCAGKRTTSDQGTEWYLRIRNMLFAP